MAFFVIFLAFIVLYCIWYA